MIIIGYQGIGKSTLAGRDHKFIDLESSNFWIDGKRADDWYKPYCKIAEHLSQQGYIVFVSSHAVVREELGRSNEIVVAVFPSIDLKSKWIAKLERRYKKTHLDKDYKAIMNARDRYEESIEEFKNDDRFFYIELAKMDYDLEATLISCRNKICMMENRYLRI